MENFLITFVLPFVSVLLIICIALLYASCGFRDRYKARIFDLNVDLDTTRKKLIDAMQQKTRANDYAKKLELENANNLKGAKECFHLIISKDKDIDRLTNINSIQSKGLKFWICEFERVKDELDKCKSDLFVFNTNGYMILNYVNQQSGEVSRAVGIDDSICNKKQEKPNQEKVKPYYYDKSRIMEVCIKSSRFIGGDYCRNVCKEKSIFGKTSKGRYIKCETLNNSLNGK